MFQVLLGDEHFLLKRTFKTTSFNFSSTGNYFQVLIQNLITERLTPNS